MPPRDGDVMHSYADIDKARSILGYKPEIQFIEGLEKTVDWFLNGHKESPIEIGAFSNNAQQ